MTGSGTVGDPYIIYNVTDLQAVNNDLDAYYELANDIDASGVSFTPIGTIANKFTGSFDGKEYSISDLSISLPTTNYVGLFGAVASGATIQNIRLVSPSIVGYDTVGGLMGYHNLATVECCGVVGGSVTGRRSVGGFVGQGGGNIDKCWSTASVYSSPDAADRYGGGFVGLCTSGITNCYVICTLYTEGADDATGRFGGFSGECSASGGVTYSYAVVSIGEIKSGVRGGFNGYLDLISEDNCFWDTTVSGIDTSAGGTGKTTTQLKTQSTFDDAPANWDFSTTWAIHAEVNSGYPYLQCVPATCTPTVTTNEATDITASSAILHGTVDTDCGIDCVCFFEWGEVEDVFTDWYCDDITRGASEEFATTDDELPDSPTNLKAATTYYFRTRVTNSWGVSYGDTLSFTTLGEVYPSEATTRVTALIHRWFPGTFTLEMNLGAVSSQFGLPTWEEEPPPSIPPEEPSPAPVVPPDVPEWAEPFFPICIAGTVMCFGRDLYKCVAGRWELQQRNSPACAGAVGAACVDGTYKIEGEVVYKCVGGQWLAYGRF